MQSKQIQLQLKIQYTHIYGTLTHTHTHSLTRICWHIGCALWNRKMAAKLTSELYYFFHFFYLYIPPESFPTPPATATGPRPCPLDSRSLGRLSVLLRLSWNLPSCRRSTGEQKGRGTGPGGQRRPERRCFD